MFYIALSEGSLSLNTDRIVTIILLDLPVLFGFLLYPTGYYNHLIKMLLFTCVPVS